MPRRDMTGPNGEGALTGRGLGRCDSNEQNFENLRSNQRNFGRGFGLGFGNGYGRRNNQNRASYLEELVVTLIEEVKSLRKEIKEK